MVPMVFVRPLNVGLVSFLTVDYITSTMKTQATIQKAQWGPLIKKTRKCLDEKQSDFGLRFNKSKTAVSLWEKDLRDPPGDVTWFVYQFLMGK